MKRRSLFAALVALGGMLCIVSTSGAAGPGLVAGPTNLMDIAKKNDGGMLLTDFRDTRTIGDAGSSGQHATLGDSTYQLAAVPPKANPKKKAGPSAKQISADLIQKCKGKPKGTKVTALNGKSWRCFSKRMTKAAPKPPSVPPAPKQKSSLDRGLDAVGQPLERMLRGIGCALTGGAETRPACGAKKA